MKPSSALHNFWDKIKRHKNTLKKTFSILIIFIIILLVLGFIQSKKDNNLGKTVRLRFDDIGELNTQAAYFTNVQVISNSRNLFGVEIPFTQNKYVYSYDGVIKAGIDFSKVTYSPDHKAKKITITIPHAIILSSEVDENSLVVYNETKNIFTPLKLDDIRSSRTQMQEEAERTAIEQGILIEAEENAKVLIWALLQSDSDLSNYTPIWKTITKEVK